MTKVLFAYINFFKCTQGNEGKYTNRFVKLHQQKIDNRNGYGYTNLASYIETNGKQEIKLSRDLRVYYENLTNPRFILELEKITGMAKEDVLGVKVDPNIGEPSQKWHLLISYLGMAWFQGKTPRIHMVSCPELWLWMFEASEIFADDELKKVYEYAVGYKTNKITREEWRDFLKEYRLKLHEIVMRGMDEV